MGGLILEQEVIALKKVNFFNFEVNMCKQIIRLFIFLLALTPALASALEKDETNWNNVLKTNTTLENLFKNLIM